MKKEYLYFHQDILILMLLHEYKLQTTKQVLKLTKNCTVLYKNGYLKCLKYSTTNQTVTSAQKFTGSCFYSCNGLFVGCEYKLDAMSSQKSKQPNWYGTRLLKNYEKENANIGACVCSNMNYLVLVRIVRVIQCFSASCIPT